MTFDLASLDTRTRAQSGVPMQLIHPRDRGPVRTDAGELVTVTLHGRASDIYCNAERAMQERRAERRARGVITTQDEFARDETELLAACTVAWNIPELDGKPFAYSDDNARRLWSDTRFAWLRDQAIGFIQADGNFLPA